MTKSLIKIGETHLSIKDGEIKIPYINGSATKEQIEESGTDRLDLFSEEYSIIESFPGRFQRDKEKRMIKFKILNAATENTGFWFRNLEYELGDSYLGSQEVGKVILLCDGKHYGQTENGIGEVLPPESGLADISYVEEKGFTEFISGISTKGALESLGKSIEMILVTEYADKKIDFEYEGSHIENHFEEGSFFIIDIPAGDQVEKIKDIQFIK